MLKPQTSATRELVPLDGLWKFALDTPDVPQPWTGALATKLQAPVPASYNDLFTDSAIRDHVGWVLLILGSSRHASRLHLCINVLTMLSGTD